MNKKDSEYDVEQWVRIAGGLVNRYNKLFLKLGQLESNVLSLNAEQVGSLAPVYVTGLARSGTTILLQILSEHPDVVTHRYRDYPFIFTPYWWNWYLDHIPSKKELSKERAHRDRICVTSESPEAMEEMIWMAFFEGLHDPAISNVLDEHTENLMFEKFYASHIKKILIARRGSSYVSKGNYNISRLAYLNKIFPKAKFIIPVRNPISHIASLMKQHRIFCQSVCKNPHNVEHLRSVGHFEFGTDMRPINNCGDASAIEILNLINNGEEVRGWARYWNNIYKVTLDKIDNSLSLSDSVFMLRYEDLCKESSSNIEQIFGFLKLSLNQPIIDKYSAALKEPDYYKIGFSERELSVIVEETKDVAAVIGYDGVFV